MKSILTILCVSAAFFLLPACAKVNVFQEPPDHPVIDSLAPASGRVGTQVRLWGSGFSTHTSLDTVRINGVLVRVDSPSTSTVLLVTLLDSTGTGPVHINVNGQPADGPVFTYLSNGVGGTKPLIAKVDQGVIDESGFALRISPNTPLPAADNDIQVLIGGVSAPIYSIVRQGSPSYNPVTGESLLIEDANVKKNAVDIYANFQVTYKGNPSNVYPVQLKPVMDDIFSRSGDYKFAAGDTITIQGHFFGSRALPSSLNIPYNGVQLQQPTILSWTSTEIRAVMPLYPTIPIGNQMGISVIVGSLESQALGCIYLGVVSGKVSLIAGSDAGSADGFGAAAAFNNPAGIALDASGNLYVADQYNNRIRKISGITAAGGTVTTVAGSTAGFRDGGAADAWFNQPAGVAVDEVGAVYVADFTNNRIRVIAGGIVSTFSGNGSTLSFYYPTGVATNNHNLVYVADMNNNRIQEIFNFNLFTLAGGVAGFADGTGAAARFKTPYGVALGADGTLYVADRDNHAIRKVSSSGVVTTFAGGTEGTIDGTGTAAQFQLPVALAVDAQGNVFVADFYGFHIRKISPQGVVSTLSPMLADGSGPANFGAPSGIAVDAQGVLYIADASSHRIYRMTQ